MKFARMVSSKLPFVVQGEVVAGFGRGSKDLGCPTANYPLEVVKKLQNVPTGVFYGWAKVDSGPVHKMVANIGWCPFYNNKEISIETHIMHKFDEDFYGSSLKICVVGFLRDEMNFKSLEELIAQIQKDISDAEEHLEQPPAQQLKKHPTFES